MAKPCQVCIHEKRFEIETRILKGANLTALSQEYNLSYQSLWDHKREHIPASLIQVQEKVNLSERFNLVEELEEIVSKTKQIFDLAYQNEKYSTALKALEGQRGSYDTLCKMLTLYQQTLSLENENLRLKSGEGDIEGEAEKDRIFSEQIKILTKSELFIFIQLQNKYLNQTEDIIIKDVDRFDNNATLLDMLKHPEHYNRIDDIILNPEQ